MNTITDFETEGRKAFERALASGRLSHDETAGNFVDNYMYMGPSANGKDDAFKNSITRQYIS